MSESVDTNASPSGPASRWLVAVEIALVFAVFFVQGATPVPDVNEPYYLEKAKHFWDSSWIADDTFLNSADTHQVFYFTFGWLSLVLPLPALAWVGRLLTWGLMAWSWRRLSFAVAPRRWLSVLTAATFVCLLERVHVAGEWVVGGVEAKGFAYVLVFLGLEALVAGRWNRVWLLLGAASAFHVLVGGWSVVAAGFAWVSIGHRRPGLLSMLPALAGGLLLSLPGLVPSMTLASGAETADVEWANQIYVFGRLSHHLAPAGFRTFFIVRFGLAAAAFAMVWWMPPVDDGRRRVRLFVGGALAIAMCGVVISVLTAGRPGLAAGLLRFYWFRLADVAVPLGIALGGPGFMAWLLGSSEDRRPVICKRPVATFIVGILAGVAAAGTLLGLGWLKYWETSFSDLVVAACAVSLILGVIWSMVLRISTSQASSRWWMPAAATGAAMLLIVVPAVHLGGHALARCVPTPPRADRLPGYSAWRLACHWIAEPRNVPPDSRFFTPPMAQTFKWYAGRSEVVNWKEIPQDAQSIVAWWRRMNDVYYTGIDDPGRRWYNSLAWLDAERLRQLGRRYDADYVLTARWPRRVNLEIVYLNESYVIYRIDRRRQ